jgi:hypothetical protein
MEREAYHHLGLHEWGIVMGFAVSKKSDSSVVISPGVALNGSGPMVVLADKGRARLTEHQWQNASDTLDLSGYRAVTIYITVSYYEKLYKYDSDYLGSSVYAQEPMISYEPAFDSNGTAREIDAIANGAQLVLAIVEFDNNGNVSAIKAHDERLPYRRRLVGQTVGELRFRRLTESGGGVAATLACSIAPQPQGGLHISVPEASEVEAVLSVGGGLSVEGDHATTLGGALNVTGATTLRQGFAVEGNVGIGTAQPAGPLHAFGARKTMPSNQTIQSITNTEKIEGKETDFIWALCEGDILCYEQQERIIKSINDRTHLTVDKPFDPPIPANSPFVYKPSALRINADDSVSFGNWLSIGKGGDAGRVWLEYGSQAAPLLVMSDWDEPPRIQFQQVGGDAITARDREHDPEFVSWIGQARSKSSDIAIMGGNVGIGTTQPAGLLHVFGGIRRGTGKITSSGKDVKGEQTKFRTELHKGDIICYQQQGGTTQERTIKEITSDSQCTLDMAFDPPIPANTELTYKTTAFLVNSDGNCRIRGGLSVESNNLTWGNFSKLSTDQGGSIELGGDSAHSGTGTPYIDFHLLSQPDQFLQLLRRDRFRLALGDRFVKAALHVVRDRLIDLLQQCRFGLTQMGGFPPGLKGKDLVDKRRQLDRWELLYRAQELLGRYVRFDVNRCHLISRVLTRKLYHNQYQSSFGNCTTRRAWIARFVNIRVIRGQMKINRRRCCSPACGIQHRVNSTGNANAHPTEPTFTPAPRRIRRRPADARRPGDETAQSARHDAAHQRRDPDPRRAARRRGERRRAGQCSAGQRRGGGGGEVIAGTISLCKGWPRRHVSCAAQSRCALAASRPSTPGIERSALRRCCRSSFTPCICCAVRVTVR